jgi:AbrB family looped-hinge helix DNA binding protein
MGDRGRLVVPAELRDHFDLRPGSSMVMVETPEGIVLATRDQAKRWIRHQLGGGSSLVDELLADRRAAAAVEQG